jgi:hypothetical protein
VNSKLPPQKTIDSPLRLLVTPERKLPANMPKANKRHEQMRSQMIRATPRMRSLAKNLMVYERPEEYTNGSVAHDDFRFNERLRPQLSTLYGIAGYRSLLSRALVMADAEVPWLREVHMMADGSLKGLEALRGHLDPDEILEGKIALLAQLLGSLVAYLGPSLTWRLLGKIWPKTSMNEADFSDRGEL